MMESLTFCAVEPPNPIERRQRTARDVLVAAIEVQIRLANSFRSGTIASTSRMKVCQPSSDNSSGRRIVQVRHRSWFWIDRAHQKFYYRPRYGNRVVDLSRCGQPTIFGGGSVDDLVASLLALKALVAAGEFDDLLGATQRGLSAAHTRPYR